MRSKFISLSISLFAVAGLVLLPAAASASPAQFYDGSEGEISSGKVTLTGWLDFATSNEWTYSCHAEISGQLTSGSAVDITAAKVDNDGGSTCAWAYDFESEMSISDGQLEFTSNGETVEAAISGFPVNWTNYFKQGHTLFGNCNYNMSGYTQTPSGEGLPLELEADWWLAEGSVGSCAEEIHVEGALTFSNGVTLR